MALQGQVLEQAVRDDSGLHMAMVRMDFPAHRVPIRIGFPVEVLVTGDTTHGGHGRHPEMVGISSDGVKGLLEGDFDFEADAVELDDLKARERKVRGHEDYFPSIGMNDGDKADEDSHRPPNEIDDPILDLNILFA